MSHTAVIYFDLDEVEELEPEDVALCLIKDLMGAGYNAYVVDIVEDVDCSGEWDGYRPRGE